MNISGIKNTVTPVDDTGALPQPQQSPKVSAINERQAAATSGNPSPPAADVVDLQAQLVEAAEAISELVNSINLDSDLQFRVDDSTGTNIITVLDGETGEVIRSFPTEESLAIARYIAEFADAPTVGLLTDQTE